MNRIIKVIGAAYLATLFGGCAPRSAITTSPPTFDSNLLSVTPAPSVTPQDTYTPFPTALRAPTRTTVPTRGFQITLIPVTPRPSATATRSTGAGAQSAKTQAPRSTATALILGIPGIGPEMPELQPILTFSANAACKQWMLAQIGIINRGTAAALDFDVQWSFGWGEPRTEHVDKLEWNAGPLWFFNGQTAVQCEAVTVLKAWIKVDPGNKVAEAIENNNDQEQPYIIVMPATAP